MLTFIVGKTGSGKTALAVQQLVRLLPKRGVGYSNIPVVHPQVNVVPFGSDDIFKKRCCVSLIDEMGISVNARKYKENSDAATNFAILNRKLDVNAYCTVQSMRYVDAMYREQDCPVWLPSRISVPVLGLLFPDSRVLTKLCSCCGKIPWDVLPDDRGWRRWLGCGTVFLVRVYDMTALDRMGAVAEAQSEAHQKKTFRKIFFRFYSQKLASIYDTHSLPNSSVPS